MADPAEESDAPLIDAWRAGDRRAGYQLFERHFDAISRFFAAKVGADAPDLIQRTFLGAVEGLASFAGRSTFRSYLFAIAYNQLCRHFRDSARDRARLDFASVSLADLRLSPSQVLGQREELRHLLAALREIPLEHQVLLELYYWERLPTAEIAEVLALPPGTVRRRLVRARELVEARLLARGQAPDLAQSTLAGLERWAAEVRAGRQTPPP
jgi:RNA polymerase sigma-70 factor (ECF subfamily)